MLQKAPDVSDVLSGETSRSHTRRIVTWVLLAGITIAAVVALWLTWTGARQPDPDRFVTEAAAIGDIHVTVVAIGTIQPTRQVEVTSQLAATVVSALADFNDRVSVGQVLARLDTTDLENRYARAVAVADARRANGLTAEANLDDARAALARVEGLSAGQNVTVRDIELANSTVKRAEAALAIARADVKAAQADLQAARGDLDKACICSPINGVILERNINQGQTIATTALGQPLFSIAGDLTSVELQVDIDEADMGQVAEGDTASFVVEAWPDRRFEGQLRQIRYLPATVDGVVTYRGVITVDNPDLLLRPGMTATADIAVDEALGVLTVPNSALRFSPEPDAAADGGIFDGVIPGSALEDDNAPASRSLWVLRDGVPVEVAVTTGITDGQHSQVVDGGLTAGERVIVGNTPA